MTGEEERAEFRRIGCVDGPLETGTVQCDFYAEFMRRSGMKNALEWAERFKRGDEFQFADIKNKKILLDIMVEGPGDGTAKHIDKKTLSEWIKERGIEIPK